jgi:hypothetical protein
VSVRVVDLFEVIDICRQQRHRMTQIVPTPRGGSSPPCAERQRRSEPPRRNPPVVSSSRTSWRRARHAPNLSLRPVRIRPPVWAYLPGHPAARA